MEAIIPEEVSRVRKELQIFVKGELVAKPVCSFDNFLSSCVDARIFEKLKAQGIIEPTPI